MLNFSINGELEGRFFGFQIIRKIFHVSPKKSGDILFHHNNPYKRKYFEIVGNKIKMIKKSLIKIINDADLKESCFNFTFLYVAGKTLSVASSAFFDFNLNRYYSVEHLAIGAGIGTLAYRKAGRGFKGVATGLAAATLFNVGWEYLEPKIPGRGEALEDTLSDIAVVYVGSAFGFFGENFKDYLNRNKSTW